MCGFHTRSATDVASMNPKASFLASRPYLPPDNGRRYWMIWRDSPTTRQKKRMSWDERAAYLQHSYFRALKDEPTYTINLTVAAPSKLFPFVIHESLVEMMDHFKEQRQMFRDIRTWRSIFGGCRLAFSRNLITHPCWL